MNTWNWICAQDEARIRDAARSLAQSAHAGQVRRESGLSFFDAHLEPVAHLVQAHSGNYLAVSVAYLHDILEDVPNGAELLSGFRCSRHFEEVSIRGIASDVEDLTEEGETWEDRKASYLAKVPDMDGSALLVSICDKVITGRDFVSEWQQGKFGKRPERILWFYSALYDAYNARTNDLDEQALPLLAEVSNTLRHLKDLWEAE